MASKKEAFIKVLNGLSDSSLISLWNRCCSENDDEENRIHINNEFEIKYIYGFWDVAKVFKSMKEFRASDPYFLHEPDGIRSFSDLDTVIDKSVLADRLILQPKILPYFATDDEYDGIFSKTFKEFLREKNVPKKVINGHLFCTDNLLSDDWDELIEAIRNAGLMEE